MLVKTYGSALAGIDAIVVTVEVSITRGVSFLMVGLPDNVVRESQQRIATAIENIGFRMPGRRIVINMAPAGIRKEGAAYDLTLAVGILAASGQIPAGMLGDFLIMGELSLDGSLLPVKGALPIAVTAARKGFRGFILPEQNAPEAALVGSLEVYGVSRLGEVADFFSGKVALKRVRVDAEQEFSRCADIHGEDFSDVCGQENVKRALEIAASGGHNVLMIGSAGSGKTMLARRLPTILPPFTLGESLETTKIHSVAGRTGNRHSLMTRRPFRSPHSSISAVAMAGGGSLPQPGEVSLSHNGVLFLDELPEFQRTVLEVLRQPLEDRVIEISRTRYSVRYPAGFMLVGSMNPCPCGNYNHPDKECVCPPGTVRKYLNRISGPLLDRIDIHIEVVPVPFDKLDRQGSAESSVPVRARVTKARKVQQDRFAGYPSVHCNAQMNTKMIREFCTISDAGKLLLKNAMVRLGLSARAFDRILKLSRTIADLEGCRSVQPEHLAEAIQYRSLDRETWAG
ncbi:MAG: ATP-binding protein [Marinilabiliales bacterium]|nr:MAG: ATP-binding protein [Marinilabiliales bacterium]